MSTLDSKPFDSGYKITTESGAENWILEQVNNLLETRAKCDISPTDLVTSVADQQLLYRKFMIKYGVALGALVALHRTSLISDVCYNNLRSKVLATLTPTVVEGRHD